MVVSLLNSNVIYDENINLDKSDVNNRSPLYKAKIYDMFILFSIGNIKNTFIEQNIIYYPIYIIKNDKVKLQIGVYETSPEQQMEIIDENGNIEVSYLNNILFYSFVNKELIKKFEYKEKSKSVYNYTENEPWIQTFMKNNNYDIIDNEGSGDCLFATIRDGLKYVNRNVSVKEQREILSNELSENTFNQYKTLYDNLMSETENIQEQLNRLVKEHKEIKTKINSSKYADLKDNLLKEREKVKKEHKELKEKLQIQKEINSEFKFMKNINTIEDLRNFIKTKNYWGDTWAISILERVLNIKLIILSSEAYSNGDLNNVLICGSTDDPVLIEKNIFEPSHYIMVEYTGNHYKLITYNDKGTLTFDEIPLDIKNMILDKCFEGERSSFKIIPDFKELITQEVITSDKKETPKDKKDKIDKKLYDDNTIFQYYIKSSGKSLPGKGAGEKINIEDITKYKELGKIPDWRKKLSNDWVQTFELDGHTWSSVEHYFNAHKFKNVSKDFYESFALDVNPNDELSTDPAFAKAAGSLTGKYKSKQIRPKNIKIDPNFDDYKDEILKKALYAKFNQNKELKQLLKETKDAKLQEFVQGNPPIVSMELMRIREQLS